MPHGRVDEPREVSTGSCIQERTWQPNLVNTLPEGQLPILPARGAEDPPVEAPRVGLSEIPSQLQIGLTSFHKAYDEACSMRPLVHEHLPQRERGPNRERCDGGHR